MKQLEEMQTRRKERERMEMIVASRIAKLFEMQGEVYKPAGDGFVFSTKTFETFRTHQTHRAESLLAEKAGYNLARFNAAVSRQ